jgi:hypothetical protein
MDFNIRLFREWKESNDYLIQKWFAEKKYAVEAWFETEPFEALEYDYFEWSETDSNGIYYGNIDFNEGEYKYRLEIIIDAENVVEGDLAEMKLVLKGYEVSTNDLIATVDRDIDEPEFTNDLFLDLITEFKTTYIDVQN